MSLLWGIVILVVADAVAIGAMLWVRRGAPEGSYFTDGDRASGVFGVLATGFAIFAGFVIFLAFTSYDESRSGAEAEALDGRPAVRDGAVPAGGDPRPGARRARVLRALRRRTRSGRGWRTAPKGTRSIPGRSRSSGACRRTEPSGRVRAVGVRQVARPDLRPGGGPARPDPRRRGHHPDLDLDRPLPDRGGRVRVHAVLRRQRRAGPLPGDADRLGHHGARRDAARHPRARQPLPAGGREHPARGHGALAAHHRRGAGGPGRHGTAPVRRERGAAT